VRVVFIAQIFSFLALLPTLKEKAQENIYKEIKLCKKCQEPANQDVCNACKLIEVLQ